MLFIRSGSLLFGQRHVSQALTQPAYAGFSSFKSLFLMFIEHLKNEKIIQ